MARTFRAKWLLPVTSPAIEDGFVVVNGGRIADFGRWQDFAGTADADLGEVVVLPGLVNAHCHLDYTVMRGAILPPASFAAWVGRINDLKRTLSDDDYLQSVETGLAEAAGFGTSTIFNVSSFPELLLRLKKPTLRVWWFLELLDVRARIATEELVAGALALVDGLVGWSGGTGLSPHAPYTTSLPLYAMAAGYCSRFRMPFMTHLAETREELEMFVKGEGTLFDFLKRVGRDMSDVPGGTPVGRLLGAGLLPQGAILAHMNVLSESDWEIVHRKAREFSVVHCPGCHLYFGRPAFELRRFQSAGVNVALGTDSLASNRSLSMFREMRRLLDAHPGVRPQEALEMATVCGARAIGASRLFGEICAGASADLIALPSQGDPYESVLSHQDSVIWVR